MKFLTSVLDTLSYIAAAQNLANDGSSALIVPDCHATFSYTPQTCMPRRVREQQPQGLTFPDTSNDDDSSHLQKGGIVELYGDGSYFATPAIIMGIKETPSMKYNLHNSITNQHHSGVDPEFIHPYQVYEDGTEAACNVGALRKIYLTPCSVDSHFIKGSGTISYHVSYLNEDDVQVQECLAFGRVQRNLPAHP